MQSLKTFLFVLLAISRGSGAFGLNPEGPLVNRSPVKLSEFKVFRLQQNKVYLEWVTEAEQNNQKFIVERSLDGEHFSFVGEVLGLGNSIKKHWYDFIDVAPKVGKNYYRLRQLDIDGKDTVLNNIGVIEVEKVIDDFFVMPNPTSEDIEISFHAFKQGLVGVKILNTTGLTLKDFYLLGEEGLNNFQIDLSDLTRGEYVIALSDFNQETFIDRITKSH